MAVVNTPYQLDAIHTDAGTQFVTSSNAIPARTTNANPITTIGASDGGTTTFWHGPIWDLYLTDPDPANSRHYPMTDMAGGTFKDVLNGRDGTIVNYDAANVAPSTQISDLWRLMLNDKLIAPPTGQYNDDWFSLLGELGFTNGALNDRELAFWVAGGTIP